MATNDQKKSSFDNDRRSFFKYSLLAIGAAVLSPYLKGRTGLAFAGSTLPMLPETDPTATALGYSSDANKVDKKKWAKKAGPDGASQKCNTCMFYTGTDKKAGKCQIFPNNSVAAGGWCNSWSKKA